MNPPAQALRTGRLPATPAWCLALLGLAYGAFVAVRDAWVCDDAFISFRYAQNLVDGLGLVYNAGERVEGYTNFLWTLIVAAGIACGAEPIAFGQGFGIAFFAATAAVLAWHSRHAAVLPVAALGLCLHRHTLWFASCGLETAMFGFLVTLGLVALLAARRPWHHGLTGGALILATMTRPDGALFYVAAGAVVLFDAVRTRSWRALLWYAAPFAAVYVPYFVWKLDYYGHPVPNTFYAKSASRPFLGQGLYYVGLYLRCYWYLIPALVAPLAIALARRGERRREALAITLFTLPYLAYVVWVGGDFMFGRFCLPVTPALLMGLELLARRGAFGAGLAAVVVSGSFLTLYPAQRIARGNPDAVVEERDHYPGWYVDANRILGQRLRELFAGQELRVAIGGGQAMLAYFGRFDYALEMHGLTDEHIAHREVVGRGRVGHEKAIALDDPYLLARRVHMIVGAYEQKPVPGDRIAAQRRFEFEVRDFPWFGGTVESGMAQATLLTYDPDILAAVAGREDVRFTAFEDFLDRYVAERLPTLDKDTVRRDLAAFDRYYFALHGDPERRDPIAAAAR